MFKNFVLQFQAFKNLLESNLKWRTTALSSWQLKSDRFTLEKTVRIGGKRKNNNKTHKTPPPALPADSSKAPADTSKKPPKEPKKSGGSHPKTPSGAPAAKK